MTPTTDDRAALLIIVPSASVGFAIAFNLGAFGLVFFDRVLAVWVIASIVLVASFVTDLPPRGWPGRIVLLLPTFWLIFAFIDRPEQPVVENGVVLLAVAVTVLSLPFIAWVLISAINPDFLRLPRSRRVAILVTVLVFTVAGWGLGYKNSAFLTCDDFKVSGNDLPANCVKVPATGES